MILLTLLVACAPRWWQSTDWKGDDTTAIGAVCESATIQQSAAEPYWMRVAVRWAEDVRVDWGSANLQVEQAEVVRSELGDIRSYGRSQIRYHTWWVVPTAEAEPGVNIDIGPYTVEWQSRDAADLRKLESDACTVTVQR